MKTTFWDGKFWSHILHRNIFPGLVIHLNIFRNFVAMKHLAPRMTPHTQMGVKLGIEDAVYEALFEHGE